MKTITEVEIIEFIKDKSHTQSQVANEYAKLLLWFTGNIVNVNYAIIERWSRSGLVRVKEMAWKIAERKLNT